MVLKMPSFAELGLLSGKLWEGPFISFYGLSLDSNMCGTEKSFQRTQRLPQGTTLTDLAQLAPEKTQFCSSFSLWRFLIFCQNSLNLHQMKDITWMLRFV